MAYSSSLSDKERVIIEPLLPQKKQTRPPLWSKRQILDGIFYQLKKKLSELGTQLEGRSPYLIDWRLPSTSIQQTLHERLCRKKQRMVR